MLDNIIGKQVNSDVVNSVGLVVIQAKTVITDEHIHLIHQHHVDPFSIIVVETREQSSQISDLTQQIVQQSKNLFESIKHEKKVPIADFKKTVIPTIEHISNDPNIFRLFEAVRAKDDYTHQHNIGVGVLSTLIGRWLNMKQEELSALSLAATLHDVGKVKIPLEILHKPGKLTNEEFQLIKQHPVFGYEMLENTVGVNHRMALVALQHHEKEDGSGYPQGLKKDKVDLFSKIVAVADIFHAMSSRRPYHEVMPFYEILSQMRQEIFGKLDPYIVSVFIKNITAKLIGKKVVLTDGSKGEIVYINPNNEANPLVKINDTFVDLSLESQIQISEIIF